MGLDMFLKRSTFLWSEDREKIKITGLKTKFKKGKVSGIDEEVGYWRKANQIHNWFVENVQDGTDDCGTYDVSEDNLIELLKLCKEVLANKEKAPELLPSSSGFFFGSTEYDEWYFKDLEDTIIIIEEVLAETNFGVQYIKYASSW